MLKGDLTSTPLAPLLLSLAEEESTGCLHISDAEGDEALIYFRTGLVYAVSVPGRRPQLGAKLVSSGALAPEALADALEAQRTELQGWKLGELLVHLGYVDQPVVEAFVKEQVNDAVWDLIRWTEGRWRFRKGEKTREDVAPPLTVTELLTTLRERGVEWEAISEVVHGPTAVPVLSAGGGGAAEMILDADAWSMLCKIDGERSVAELARDCGYTLFEAGQVLVSLVQAGLVDIEEDVEVSAGSAPMPAPTAVSGDDEDSLYGATSVSSALAAAALADAAADALADAAAAADEAAIAAVAAAVAGVSGEAAEGAADGADDDFAALARLVSEVAAGVREDEEAQSDAAMAATSVDSGRGEPAAGSVPLRPDSQAFATSVERVSAALAEVLGPAPVTDDPFEVPAEMRVKRTRKKERQAPPPLDPRAARVRAAAAQELAAAHALAEALREAAADEAPTPTLRRKRADAGEAARVEAERVAAEVEAARLAAEEAARVEAESPSTATAEEAARLAAEEEAARAEAERLAAEEAARVEAERVAAEEEAARLAAEEAARTEAERVAAEEETARLAAEEVARAEAERIAAEEAARAEAERIAAEEAARLEAERLAAEEAARVEAERVAAEEEATRLAAEEAERIAAEEAAHAEAERIAAEEEAARLAAEEEAARIAAEEEAARLAAEQAAARIAAEEEAVRIAAEEEAARAEAERFAAEEAARVLAEEEAAREAAERLAAEKSLAEDQAWTEYWSREADRVAAEEAAVQEAASRESERAAVEQARELAEAAAVRAAAEAEARALEEDEVEATRQRNKSAASAALAELAHDFDATPAEDAAGEPLDDEINDEPVGVPVTVGAPSMEMADTAALLRELSSLGLEDDPTPPPPPRVPSRPTPPAADPKKKKKRGLFGL